MTPTSDGRHERKRKTKLFPFNNYHLIDPTKMTNLASVIGTRVNCLGLMKTKLNNFTFEYGI